MTKEKMLEKALWLACAQLALVFCYNGYKPYTRENLIRHFKRLAKKEAR